MAKLWREVRGGAGSACMAMVCVGRGVMQCVCGGEVRSSKAVTRGRREAAGWCFVFRDACFLHNRDAFPGKAITSQCEKAIGIEDRTSPLLRRIPFSPFIHNRTFRALSHCGTIIHNEDSFAEREPSSDQKLSSEPLPFWQFPEFSTAAGQS